MRPTFHHLNGDNAKQLLGADVFDKPVDARELQAFVDDPAHEMVFATAAARVIGMASGTLLRHPDKAPMLFVNEVGVAEDMRRRGVATALMRKLMDLAAARGCTGIWLATETGNVAARTLYRKIGGRETGGIIVYDWGGVMDDA